VIDLACTMEAQRLVRRVEGWRVFEPVQRSRDLERLAMWMTAHGGWTDDEAREIWRQIRAGDDV